MWIKQPFTSKWKLAVVCIAFFLMACAVKTATTSKSIQFGGWVTYWDFKRGMETAQTENGIYRDIFLFLAQLNGDGTPIMVKSKTIDYHYAINQLNSSGIRTWMTVVNDVKSFEGNKSILKDPQMVHSILKNHTLRLKHIREIVALALKHKVSGVDIDYENLLPEDRIPFSLFVAELSSEFKKRNLALSVTVQPKTMNRSASGKGAMDWSELCQHADRLQIMLYNLHGKKTGPGPMATLDWISDVLKYAKGQCKPGTIVPILKISGMHWESNGVTSVQYDQAVSLQNNHKTLLERKATSQVPFFTYQEKESTHVVYFEDALSLKIKLNRILSLGFDKVVFWSLGRQDPHLASELKDFL